MHENRDEDEPHYTDDSKTSKIQDDASFEEKLIEEVRRYNHLYNTSLKDYKDFTITSNSWKEIAQTLRVEEQVCRTKWKKLRDRYVRLRRKIKGKSGGAASGIQTQILTTLSWLSGFIKHKETKSDYPQAPIKVKFCNIFLHFKLDQEMVKTNLFFCKSAYSSCIIIHPQT
ncbi:unnamed protein product [Oncorhynchus mykiss]|uniref:MADF domain-containing protein n=1 Tax=Oncorhynchus mykiss TaxID=8022 RepID=A0A060XPE5_ONCMY|nr:unnamed protein product [Oncorhynchus mykiss]